MKILLSMKTSAGIIGDFRLFSRPIQTGALQQPLWMIYEYGFADEGSRRVSFFRRTLIRLIISILPICIMRQSWQQRLVPGKP
jgi:hypothetical protein